MAHLVVSGKNRGSRETTASQGEGKIARNQWEKLSQDFFVLCFRSICTVVPRSLVHPAAVGSRIEFICAMLREPRSDGMVTVRRGNGG